MFEAIKASLSGEFNLKVIDKDGNIKHDLTFENLITDYGLNAFANTGLGNASVIGTGNSVPSVTQSQLDAPVAIASTSSNETPAAIILYDVDNIPEYVMMPAVKKSRFNAGRFNGEVLREIGIMMSGGTLADNKLFSRTLIKDSQGNPMSISIASDEVLDVTYTLKTYLPLKTKRGSFQIKDRAGNLLQTVGYDVNIQKKTYNAGNLSSGSAMSATAWAKIYAWKVAPTFDENNMAVVPSGSSSLGSADGYLASYVENSLVRKLQFSIGLDNWVGAIKTIQVVHVNPLSFVFTLDTPILKTNEQLLWVYINISWGRK